MNDDSEPSCIGVIPARFGSTRFPGKPLEKILGKSLIQRSYENAMQCKAFDDVIVATDDSRIFDHVTAFGGKVVMTSLEAPTGTDRVAEVAKEIPSINAETILVNIQGDEPCLESDVLTGVVNQLKKDPTAMMATACVKISSEEEAHNPSVVKCVLDKQGRALYFSRALIPAGRYDPKQTYYRHLGLYAFRYSFLLEYLHLPTTPLMQFESLEQLKVLEHGYSISVAIVESKSIGVDTPEDILKLEKILS